MKQSFEMKLLVSQSQCFLELVITVLLNLDLFHNLLIVKDLYNSFCSFLAGIANILTFSQSKFKSSLVSIIAKTKSLKCVNSYTTTPVVYTDALYTSIKEANVVV